MKKLLLLPAWWLLVSQALVAQLKQPVLAPVSPEVATLGRFIDVPVGTYSGVPDISVPLYEVKYRSLSIPLSLSYHSGGVRVEDEASWVGLNWDLFSGGFISQAIIGDDTPGLDEQLSGLPDSYNTFKDRFPGNPFAAIPEATFGVASGCYDNRPGLGYPNDESRIIQLYLKRGWGQPDVYTFSAPGIGGKFVINPETREPVVLQNRESISIEKIGTTSLPGWKIKTLSGVEYTFNVFSESQAGARITTRTWKMTSMKSMDGSVITFVYLPYKSHGQSFSENLKSEFFTNEVTPYCSPSGAPTIVPIVNSDYYLTKISTPSENIEFILENRADINGALVSGQNTVKRLKEVLVRDKFTKQLRSAYRFRYGYFEGDPSGNNYKPIPAEQSARDVFCKRLKLVSVQQVGFDNASNRVDSLPPYTFEYNERISLPSKISFAQDYWGYYNGRRSNTTMLPDIAALYLATTTYGIPPVSLLESPYQANRGPDRNYVQAGILERINLPLGGARVFTYEDNDFSNFAFYDAQQISRTTVQNSVTDRNISSGSAQMDIGGLSRDANVRFEFRINPGVQNLSFDQLKMAKAMLVKKVNGVVSGNPIKVWQLIDNQETRLNFDMQVSTDGYYHVVDNIILYGNGPNEKYWLVVDLPDALGPQNNSQQTAAIGCTFKYLTAAVSGATKFYGAGLRIASISLLDENNVCRLKRKYTYKLPGTGKTSGVLLTPPGFLSISQRMYTHMPNAACDYWTVTPSVSYMTVSSASGISLSSSPTSNAVGYTSVRVIEVPGDGTSPTNGMMQYDFINRQNLFDWEMPVDARSDNGLPVRTAWLTRDSTLVKEELMTYKLTNVEKEIYGYTLDDRNLNAPDCGSCVNFPWYYFYPRFTIRRYAIRSRDIRLASTTTREYNGANVLGTTTDFTYNDKGLRIAESMTDSKGDVITTRRYYPQDFSDSISVNMMRKFYSPMLEEKSFVNEVLQKRSLNQFEFIAPGAYQQKATQRFSRENKMFDWMNCTSFSALTGNVKEFAGKNELNTVILWGRGGVVPIARVEGVKMSVVNSKVNSAYLETLSSVLTLRSELMKLYTIPGAFVNLYFYDVKGQLIETVDPRKQSAFFEYDALGRTSLLRDAARNILAEYQYHLR